MLAGLVSRLGRWPCLLGASNPPPMHLIRARYALSQAVGGAAASARCWQEAAAELAALKPAAGGALEGRHAAKLALLEGLLAARGLAEGGGEGGGSGGGV